MADEEYGNDVQGSDNFDFDGSESNGTDGNESQTGNDLYAPYLAKFPDSLHGIAREVFSEWDGNVTKRIQKVHDEYAPYKPLIEAYEPDALQQAVQLTESLEADPQAFYNALAGAYGFEAQQAAQEILDEEPDDTQYDEGAVDPRLLQQEQLLTSVAEYIIQEREQREAAERKQLEDQLYEQTMADLKAKHGEFDVAYVNSLLAQGIDPEAAVQHFKSTVEQWASKQNAPARQAPIVMGSGGGVPAGIADVKSLTAEQRQDLVAEMLRQAQQG